MKLTTLVVTSVLSLAPLCAALADSGEVHRQRVQFTDLDLTKEQGMSALYERLQHAARDVCADAGAKGLKFDSISLRAECTKEAFNMAVKRIADPRFSGYAAARAAMPSKVTQVAAR